MCWIMTLTEDFYDSVVCANAEVARTKFNNRPQIWSCEESMTCESMTRGSGFRAHQVQFVHHFTPFKASHLDLFATLAVHS